MRERLRAGDHDAFATVYRRHVTAVFRLASGLTGDAATAEDVTSETFLAAWRTRGAIDVDDRPLRPWLLGIATHQSLNARRSVRRRLSFLARRLVHDDVVADFADDAAGRLDDLDQLARTRRALAALNRTEVEVIALCVWSGLSYGEAADTLGVPVGTVRSRLSRARARLRELAADASDPPPRPAVVPAPPALSLRERRDP